tara:strand:- start:17632 stop:17940 length:309 start_codon:yes stop_codon:yes gene_type:complete
MTEKQHKEAINCLAVINNLKIKSTVLNKTKNLIKIEYKHQVVDLGKYSLILSGTLEQFHSKSYSKDKMFLVISLLDNNNQDMAFTPKQMDSFKNVIKEKIFA